MGKMKTTNERQLAAAHKILNKVRDGQGREIPGYLIEWALKKTGDL
jgi:hypothetical protein